MILFRHAALAGLSCFALAAPAQSQITPEELWTLWETMAKDSGYSLEVGARDRDGDDLTLTDVKVALKGEGASAESVIEEITLTQVGETVEFTFPEAITFTSAMSMPDETGEIGEPVNMQTLITHSGYKGVASGSAETPKMEFTAERMGIDHTIETKDGEPAPKTVVTMRDLSGVTSVLSRKPFTIEQSGRVAGFTADFEMKVPDETGAEVKVTSSMKVSDIVGSYGGTMPEGNLEEMDLNQMLAAGFVGKGSVETGAIRNQLDLPKAVGFPSFTFLGASSRFDYDLKRDGMKLLVDLKGMDVAKPGEAPVAADASGAVTADVDAVFHEGTAAVEGVPEASGTLKLTLDNLQPFMQRIVAAGLMPEEELMGIQFMASMFTRPGATPTQLESLIEFSREGNISVNGQQLQ